MQKRDNKDKKVKIWLSKLKAVAYAADDLFDEITTQVLQRQLVKRKFLVEYSSGKWKDHLRRIQSSIYEETRRQVRITSFTLQSILSSFEMSRKLTEIVERLDDIEREMSTFQLREVVGYKRSDTMEKRETGPFVDGSEVYGRSEDVRRIIDLLLLADFENWAIPIVGIGGIGKTTLAQLVYNDQSLDGHFDMKIWVSLYDNFSTKKLLSEILECVTKRRCESLQMGVLQSQPQESLCGKWYLLVLDDVWNDDPEEWDKIRNLFRCGAEGSKIIVTTRSQQVASAISTTPPYLLEALAKDDCWTLFKRQAFLYGEEDAHSNLLPVGQQITDKCQGVPLAAKVLGGLLRSKRETAEWERVQRSELWNLDADDGPDLLEQVGNDCFNHLLNMSFFQPASSSNVVEFKVPNLIYDLAKSVAGNEFLTMRNRSNSEQAQVVAGNLVETRLAMVDNDYRSNVLPEVLYNAHKLCSLNLLASGDISMEALRKLVSSFRHLKILNLSGSGIKRMHRSIGELIYLRYLDLSNTSLETLPKTIGHLCNLRTLDLSGCTDLVELPNEIIMLAKLIHLNIKDCARLACLPANIFWNLVRLQTLPILFAGKDYEMFRYLKYLRGELKIKHLENVTHARPLEIPLELVNTNRRQKVRKILLLESLQLHTLGLYWGDGGEGKLNQNTSRQTTQTKIVSEDLLHGLQPNRNIRSLSINGYPGFRFPLWMNSDAISNLTELELINCRSCETLPELGQLPVLKCLNIQGMDNVVRIDNEFSGEGVRPFPSLNELTLRDFPQLRTWESMGSTEAFPCLKRLSIMRCPLLKTMPWFPTLQHLTVQNCDSLLLRSAAQLRTLLTLVIDSFVESTFITKVLLENCSLLISLTIISCPKLPELPSNLGKLTALKSLKIGWCEMLHNLPHELTNLIALENFEIIECPRLITLPEQSFEGLSSLRSLSIENCNCLISLPTALQHATALERLTIMYCSDLASLPDGLQNLLALKSLTILSCPKLTTLPEGVQHMKMLQNLEIRICPELTALPKLENLILLRSLAISDCPNMKCLPEGIKQLRELQHLSIQACPELEKRCKEGKGEDWPIISHIRFIYIGPSILQNREDTAASSSSS